MCRNRDIGWSGRPASRRRTSAWRISCSVTAMNFGCWAMSSLGSGCSIGFPQLVLLAFQCGGNVFLLWRRRRRDYRQCIAIGHFIFLPTSFTRAYMRVWQRWHSKPTCSGSGSTAASPSVVGEGWWPAGCEAGAGTMNFVPHWAQRPLSARHLDGEIVVRTAAGAGDRSDVGTGRRHKWMARLNSCEFSYQYTRLRTAVGGWELSW